jgi:hypothetical protein
VVHRCRSYALVALLACTAFGLDIDGELAAPEASDAQAPAHDGSVPPGSDGSTSIHDAAATPDGAAPVDASTSVDAMTADAFVPPPIDAGAPDTGPPPCNGLLCDGVCMQGASNCSSCTDASVTCAASGTCVSDCSRCASNPIGCYVCDANHANPVAHCEAIGPSGNCNGDYAALTTRHCECGEAADCPGASQACIDDQGVNVCFACGETDMGITTAGQDCRGGGTCTTTTPTPTCQ